jgi:hypothetical protein
MARLKRMVFNAVTFVPGIAALPVVKSHLRKRTSETGDGANARYCYSVWLRHLVHLHKLGLNSNPGHVAELGPGDSLGTGLTALLCGAERYSALDIVQHASQPSNLVMFDELTTLLRDRAQIPDEQEFPLVGPTLPSYEFPLAILTEGRLEAALHPTRLQRIRDSLSGKLGQDSLIRYRAPWYGKHVIERASVDLIYSQAVLEHVDDLARTYEAMFDWLKPSGVLSHEVDFKSHGWATTWDGHWSYSPLMWKLIRGKDSWSINREPFSTHARLLNTAGFRIVARSDVKKQPTIRRKDLASTHRSMTQDDLHTAESYVVAVKKS